MRRMHIPALIILAFLPTAGSADFQFQDTPDGKVLVKDGQIWLKTVTTPYDSANREATYKTYTHIYSFDGDYPLTKGLGGLFPHQRGVFIGWIKTQIFEDSKRSVVDSWHCKGCYQEHSKWLELSGDFNGATMRQEVLWKKNDGDAYIREERQFIIHQQDDNTRIIDFSSKLESLKDTVRLTGDLHHSGVSIRLADEVGKHPETTRIILPDGAKEWTNNRVVGAWWLATGAQIQDKNWWILYMVPRSHPTGPPVFSARRYGKPGAVHDVILSRGKPVTLNFRFVITDKELTKDRCVNFYAEYSPLIP